MILVAAICVLAVGASAQVGSSGIISPDGVNTQFSHAFARNIVLIGPSGIVTNTGNNRQLTQGEAALHVATRAKRGLLGPSGFISKDGIPVQFSRPGVTLVLEGPSGYVFSDGTQVQKRSKRSPSEAVVGPSGIITPDGRLIQLEPGVTVSSAGPSGAVLSNGANIQYQ